MSSIQLNVKHNGPSVQAELNNTSRSVERAVIDATYDATEQLRLDAHEIIRGIAGGVYWDVDAPGVTVTPRGAKGTVATPSSKEHKIPEEPKTAPGDFLVFYWKKRGRWMKTRQVNHPGSQPVNWISRLDEKTYGRIYEDNLRRAFDSRGGSMPLASAL